MHPKTAFLNLSAAVLLLTGLCGAAEFSRSEWDDPGRAGSSLWIKNKRARMVALDAFYMRNTGFQTYGEVAVNAGPRRVYFTVDKDRGGNWVRLIPRSSRRIWVRAQDSLMLSRFECGRGLKSGKRNRQAAAEFVLDLKVVDNWGDTAVVKLFQVEPRYDIEERPGTARSRPADGWDAGEAWSNGSVTQGDLNIP